MAFKKAAAQADPALLEPMMAVEVRTPDEYMGDVIGDLNSRRGQIQAMEERSGVRVVKALVPLSEMFAKSRGEEPALSTDPPTGVGGSQHQRGETSGEGQVPAD